MKFTHGAPRSSRAQSALPYLKSSKFKEKKGDEFYNELLHRLYELRSLAFDMFKQTT